MTTKLARFFSRTFALGLTLAICGRAFGASHVLVITAAPDPKIAAFQLLDVTGSSHKKIADIHGSFMFGNDDSRFALVEQSTNGSQLLVVNRKNSRVVARTALTNVSLLSMLGMVSDNLSVYSKNSTVCFPIADKMHGIKASLLSADWTKGKTNALPDTMGGLGLPMVWTTTPVGFVVGFPIGLPAGGAGMQHFVRMASYDVTAPKQLFSADQADDGNSWARHEIFYVPKVGVMHTYRGTISQLTGPDCASVVTNHPAIPTSGADSKVFVRTIKGKTCLIWGEDNSAEGLAGRNTGLITDLVIFDLDTKTELLRKALTPKASVVFQPDTRCEKIYFVDPRTGKASYLDVAKQTIMPFADLGTAPASSPMMHPTLNPTIVDAY